MTRVAVFLNLILINNWLLAQPGSNDSTFRIGKGFDGIVQSIALQPDGKLIAGGEFKSFNGKEFKGLVRLNPDGRLDTTFDTKGKVNVRICRSIILQKDGKILVGGLIGDPYTDGKPYNFVRLNKGGDIDETFKTSRGFGLVHTIALQPDGKILVGGDFKPSLVRLNQDGSIDATFKVFDTFKEIPFSIALQPNGKIIVAVRFSTSNMNWKKLIQRLNIDGSLDTSFNINEGFKRQTEVWKIALTKNGKLLAEGGLRNEKSRRNMISLLNSDGSIDTTFKTYVIGRYRIFDIVIQPDNKIIVAGDFDLIEEKKQSGIARLFPNGTLDSTFLAPNFSIGQNKVAILPNGKIIATGEVGGLNMTKDERKYITRLNGDLVITDKQKTKPKDKK